MFIGVARFELYFPASGSLKSKRALLRPVLAQVQNKFNVSIAEVDHQNLWQRASLGVSCVSESVGQCRKVMQEVEKAIGRAALEGGELIDRTIEYVSMEDIQE